MIKNLKFILSTAFLFVATGLFFETTITSESKAVSAAAPNKKIKKVRINENENKVFSYNKNQHVMRGGATSSAFAAAKPKKGFFSKKIK